DPQAAELDPAQDLFEGQAGDPSVHHGGQLGRRPGRVDEQLRLVLGEDTAGGPEPGGDGGGSGGWESRQENPFGCRWALSRSPTSGEPRGRAARAPGLHWRSRVSPPRSLLHVPPTVTPPPAAPPAKARRQPGRVRRRGRRQTRVETGPYRPARRPGGAGRRPHRRSATTPSCGSPRSPTRRGRRARGGGAQNHPGTLPGRPGSTARTPARGP